jgi:hypothetical protein
LHAGSYAAPDSHFAKVTGGRVGAGPTVGAAFIWTVPFFGPADDGTDGRAVGHAPLPA